MSVANYEATYAGMTDDEVLRLACEASGLKEGARQALNAELKKRKLTQADVAECEQRLATLQPGVMAANQKYVARSFAGSGTTLYGKRDFYTDGSYLTTKWITLLWVPVFPLASIRVGKSRAGSGTAERKVSEHHLGHYATWTTEYSVYSEGPINRAQVLSVYAFVLAMAAIERSPAYLSRRIVFVLFGTLCMLPWILRRTAPRSHG
jgi:hypothetical protein